MEDAPPTTAQQASVEDADVDPDPMREDGAENGDGSVQEEEPDEDEVPKVRIVRYVFVSSFYLYLSIYAFLL